jgi:CHAD domain-containing protein
MLGTTTLASLLDEQTSVLQTRLKAVYDGDADSVHDSRVATRRIRELLALVPSIPGRDGEASVTAGYRKIGRSLGRVRDVDVQIAHIKDLEAHAPQTAPSLVLVRQAYEKKRLKRMRQLIKTLERLDVNALLHFVGDGHPAGLRTRLTSSGWRQQIRRLAVERSRNALSAIDHATGVYFPKRSHSARIAIKQLRYAAEIALRTGFEEIRAAISVLKKGQEILGELHDKQVLANALRSYPKARDVDAEHLTITGQVLEGDVLQIHSDYLCRRDALREACSQIERVASRSSPVRSAVGVGAALVVSGLVWNRSRAGITQKASNTQTGESEQPANERAEMIVSATR